jgi:O-acetylserine/cysteine efflux transporter
MRGRLPVVALVVAAMSWGIATTGTKYALGSFGPFALLALELLLAAVVLWLVVVVRGFRRPSSLRRVALMGLCEPALAYLSETIGLTRTTATNGAMIQGLECVFVVLLAAVILREPISRAVGVAIGLAMVGLVVLEGGGGLAGPGVGDGLVLFGALSAAAYTIIARGLDPADDPMSVTAVQFAVAGLVSLPLAGGALLRGTETLPHQLDSRSLVVAAFVGIVGYAGSFVLYNHAITMVRAAPAAVVINLIPAVGFISAVVLLGEPLTGWALGGAALICASVGIFTLLEAKPLDAKPPEAVSAPAAVPAEPAAVPEPAAVAGGW